MSLDFNESAILRPAKVFPRPTIGLARVTIALGCLFLLAGCAFLRGSDQGQTENGASVAQAFTNPPPSQSDWGGQEVVQPYCTPADRVLIEIVTQSANGFDETTFVIDGPPPCYRIGITDDPVQDGSGFPIEIGSPKAIRVELQGFDPGEDSIPDSAQGIAPGATFGRAEGTYSQQVMLSTIYEQSATSFIGVNANAQFAVQTLLNPTRIVVSVRDAN